MPKGSKRVRQSPRKGKDNCAVCDDSLNESSSAIECDQCRKWLCASCLNLSDDEYNLLNKMNSKIGCQWYCTLCKVNNQGSSATMPAATVEDVTKIVESAMSKLQASLLQSMNNVCQDLKENLDRVKEQVNNLEIALQSKCDEPQTRQVVSEMLKNHTVTEVRQTLEDETRRLINSELNKELRKNNIVAYGVPTSADDEAYLKSYLESEYDMPTISITQIRRLPVNTPTPSSRPPPLLLTLASTSTKYAILKKSFEKKSDIRFFNDLTKEERLKHKELVQELKNRVALGEHDLCIRSGRIVSKNGRDRHPGGSRDTMPMQF